MRRQRLAFVAAVLLTVVGCGTAEVPTGGPAASGAASGMPAEASTSPSRTPPADASGASPSTPGPAVEAVGVPAATTAATPDGRKRNVLLVIADDFGIDLSPCYPQGSDKPRMPNLERMCREGLVFDTVWASPLCTPTRATLMSAKYGFRTGVLQVGDVLHDTDSVMKALHTVDPEYANAVIGKWHISGDDDIDPNAPASFGVDHYAGFMSAFTRDFFHWDYVEDGTPGHSTTYTTTWMTDRALEWIGAQGDRPWFLWLAQNDPHFPLHLPPDGLHHYTDLTGTQADIEARPRAYAKAQSEALDTEVGRLLASLDPAVRANTTVIFIGDNGTDGPVAVAPFGEDTSKFSIHEGGIRIPLIVSGAGVDRAGQREDSLVNAVDIPATVLEIAGSGRRRFHDGLSFAGAFTDPAFAGRRHLYMDAIRKDPFDGRPGWAVSDGHYKLIEYEDGGRELYDVDADIGEHENLVAGGSVPAELHSIYDELEAFGLHVRSQ